MNDVQPHHVTQAPAMAFGWPRRWLHEIGKSTIGFGRGCAQITSLALATLSHAARPRTWRRRTVRQEFVRQCYEMGVAALPSIAAVAILIGLALVFQTLYWLKLAGQMSLIGTFLVLALVREIAPIAVGLILIGRSATVTLVELANMRRDGQVHMLNAQGIDPFLYLVIPRVVAFSLSAFCLCIVFLGVALTAGYFAANLAGVVEVSLLDFYGLVLKGMGPAEYVLVPLKTWAIGFVIGISICLTALAGSEADAMKLLPRGFIAAVLATFLVSGILTLLL